MNHIKTTLAVATAALTLAGPAVADELGQQEYMAACASCHGPAGKGDGPLAELMTVKVPGLTSLSADNDGVFPMLAVIHSIDGRQGTRGHGYPMPVWGDRYASNVEDAGQYGAEAIVRGRVLSIAYYLESIQE